MINVKDKWAGGLKYEEFMGRWSRALGREFVSWLDLPKGLDWLDIGCGTGALADAVCHLSDPRSVTACDPAEPIINFARQNVSDNRQSFVVAGIDDLPRRATGFGSVSSLLSLNFMPDLNAALRQMRYVATPNSTVSACVWDYSDGMQFLRIFWDVAASLDSSASLIDEGVRFPICRREALAELFRDSALTKVRCEGIDIPTVFASFEDYWQPFLGGTGPAPSYVGSLTEEARQELAQKLQIALEPEPDGSIVLTARAWAVCGQVGDLDGHQRDDNT